MPFDVNRRSLDQEDAVLGALMEMHRSRQERANTADSAGSYGRILRHFEQRGQRLRGERLVTAELVERLFRAGSGSFTRRVHQELEIVGAAGSVAAGRLRVVNRSGSPAQFELIVGEPADGEIRPEVTFDIAQGRLDAGEMRLVRVAASLTGVSEGHSISVPVECRWPTGRDRIWLVVSAVGPSSPIASEPGRTR